MISQQVAEYVAKVKYTTDLPSLRRARKFVDAFQKQMNTSTQKALKAGVENNLTFDKGKIAQRLQTALNNLPLNFVLKIDKFAVDKVALRKTLSEALNKEKNYKIGVTPVFSGRGVQQQTRAVRASNGGIRRSLTLPSNTMLMTGGALTGGFGASMLNKQVSDWNMLETKFAAITGSKDVAKNKVSMLRNLASEVGGSPLDLAQSYTQMLATAQGTPFEAEMDKGFSSFTKYGKVMGLDAEAMKGSQRAY
jgi:hypothetical protein